MNSSFINATEHRNSRLFICVIFIFNLQFYNEIKRMFTGIGKLDLFRIVLRKNAIYNNEGKHIKEFMITMKESTFYCPIITYNSQEKNSEISYSNQEVNTCSIEPRFNEENDTDIYIAFDQEFDFKSF